MRRWTAQGLGRPHRREGVVKDARAAIMPASPLASGAAKRPLRTGVARSPSDDLDPPSHRHPFRFRLLPSRDGLDTCGLGLGRSHR